jgi:hypothetical protein
VTVPASRNRAVLLAALVALLVAIVVGASRGGSGAGGPPPATGAAAVVPAQALAYVHLSTDTERPGVKRALALAARFPDYRLLSTLIATRLGRLSPNGAAITFAADIRPWLGKEAAVALLDTGTSTAGALIVLDVADVGKARAFVTRIGAGAGGSYRGVRLYQHAGGGEFAFVSRYLVLGQDASVRAAIDVVAGHAPSLASDPSYRAAADGEPADRVLDAYASAAGVRRLLVAQGGLLGAVGVLLYQPALSGVAVSVSAASPGARVVVHSALDPHLLQVQGAAPRSFTPTLEPRLPAGSTLALDVIDLHRIAPRVLSAGAAGGVGGGLGPLLARLGTALRAEGVNVADILKLFDGETAIAIAPGSGSGTPALVIVARTSDETRTRAELAQLEVPLAQLFSSSNLSSGQEPAFTDRTVAGVTVHQLPLASGLQLDYAVFDRLVAVSTSLGGIASIASHAQVLADDPSYRATLAKRRSRVTSLLFLDFSQLLSLGEQTGLTRGARFQALRGDLQKLRAVGLSSTAGEAESTAELFLQIS